MTLCRRLALLAAGVVGVTVVLASLLCYLAMRGELRGQVDDALRAQADLVARVARVPDVLGSLPHDEPALAVPRALPAPPASAGGPASYVQLLDAHGRALAGRTDDERRLPVGDRERAVAHGSAPDFLADREVAGEHVRVLTAALAGGGAVQLARSLAPTDRVLARLRLVLAGLCLAGTALAALLGRAFARPVVRPVADLTEAAEHVTATEDLGRRVQARGEDEVGRLAARFNTMLDTLAASRAALAASVRAQRQLVADASHELRTPVTSLRTNIEVLLADDGALDAAERGRLLADVRDQLEDLGALITDVIDLARGDPPAGEREDVALDALVAQAVDRARRLHPGVRFAAELEPTVVEGLPDRLARAVGNLLDNAARHGPPGGVVEVALRGGMLTVRDHGPGVPPEDAPHVFDRFFRGAAARGRPGSGLGLAIVKQVAEGHGGCVAVEDAPGGGALFRLRLPTSATASPEGPPPAPPAAAPAGRGAR